MEYIVETKNMTKVFQERTLLQDIGLQVRKGEVYGLLGPNGAGKTTLLKTLVNLVHPTTGIVKVFNKNIEDSGHSYLRDIGTLIEVPVHYEKLTGRKNLELHASYLSYANSQRIDEVLALVKLTDAANQKVQRYSLGMKQRLAIAKAMLLKPKLLLLDEPINGLDPSGIREMRDIFRTLSREHGITLIISSHILSELEQIVDTIAILDKGKLLEQLTIAELRSRSNSYFVVKTTHAEQIVTKLAIELNLKNYKLVSDEQINIYDLNCSYNDIIKVLSQLDTIILSVEQKQSSLEDYFLKKTEAGDLYV